MIKSKTGLLAALLLFWLGAHAPGLLAEEELIYEGPAPAEKPVGNYTQEWRVLPGESLQSLAALFYPKSPHMQQRFVASTLALNREKLANVSPRQPFEQSITLRIPELRALSFQGGGKVPSPPSTKPAAGTSGNKAIPRSKTSTEYSAISKSHQSRKQELEALNRRLKSLEDTSSAMRQKLAPGSLPTDEAAPRTLRRVQPPPTSAPESASLLEIALYLLAGALLAVAVFAYRWHKTRIQKLARHTETLPAPPESAVAAPFRAPASPAAPAQPKKPQPVQAAPQSDDSISVDEIESVVEEARVIVALGRTANAIKLLTDHIERYPRAAVSPWLYLLELYRATGNRPDFESFGKRMHATFNVMVPAWDNGKTPLSVPVSLEEFPHLTQKISGMWGTPECRDYLNHLIQDNRDGERIGFSVQVMQEIVLLLAILDVRT